MEGGIRMVENTIVVPAQIAGGNRPGYRRSERADKRIQQPRRLRIVAGKQADE